MVASTFRVSSKVLGCKEKKWPLNAGDIQSVHHNTQIEPALHKQVPQCCRCQEVLQCGRCHAIPLNPWKSSSLPIYRVAGSTFKLFENIKKSLYKPLGKDGEFMAIERRPTGDHSLNYHHSRIQHKDVQPHHVTSLSCGRLHEIPLHPWNASIQPTYSSATSINQIFENLVDSKKSKAAKLALKAFALDRRPTNDQSLNYHHSRKHAKDIEPYHYHGLACGRKHYIPDKSWKACNRATCSLTSSCNQQFGTITKSKMKEQVPKSKPSPCSEDCKTGTCKVVPRRSVSV